ncbi:D-lactate dehydrogenase [Pseudomonas putida]|uniref:D-lactate dehydrogenase n=1 Tax=Pseudomonas putida TaxID=303 RepID=UPI00125FC5CF|nr:D-lactate dehydrogenase [Pseudomonas putida]KAB5625413.1 D-lactate dehydrogenase [Pseudomonas putida]
MHQHPILKALAAVIDEANLLTDDAQKSYYCKGFRYGHGKALAVALPKSLLQLWQLLNVCQEHDAVILMQASNTGLTGGSTPYGDDYDRPVVVISTRLLKGVQVIDDAKQIIAFPGSTLTELEESLKPFGREPHSVIGSSCIGASVVGGICNNSGGSLLQRGPAFTEKSLYAHIDTDGHVKLINHLGIDLGASPEEILSNLENGSFTTGDAEGWEGKIWADDYYGVIKDVDAATPTRFNGNPQYLHGSSGCAGKVIVFAVRLATFEAVKEEVTYYMGTNDEKALLSLRRQLIENLDRLPIQAEYINRTAFRLTLRYARHMYLSIKRFGPASLPKLMQKKAHWDALVKRLRFLPTNFIDRLIQLGNRVIPSGMAPRLMEFDSIYEHHLMIKVDKASSAQMQEQLKSFFANNWGDWFKCTADEQRDAFLLRFAVGGTPIFYCDYHGINPEKQLISLDVALRRNDDSWMITLPPHLQEQVLAECCCGHFFCLVNHQDYILRPGVDAQKFKEEVVRYLDQRGARYPAEHNIGHVYKASYEHEKHFRDLDPTNCCNPGIGKTSKLKNWA